MAKFRYKRGDRPLDGYTIEYGLGVGGFGEVYFAISDAGREVALKSLQNYEEIELRGIRHCMNLKSPHLVSVFDVRYNDDEEPFVIMEYVQGPSLRQLLDGSPEGIGPTKAAFFLREMAKGLTYLHEAGVVHRDLKPHNVFYEDGFVKIGDYSLCKMISTSHRTGHTMTVGTVHYMAPEISQGRYDASVDIYALGILLYEMLTGEPPFKGDSLGEVLMKHMTAEPDLSKLEEPYRSVVAKALDRNPDDRFGSAAEMVEAVFGTEHVQNSVVEFNPQELTIVANMATKRAFTTPSGRSASDRPGGASWGKTWKPNSGSDVGGKFSGGDDSVDDGSRDFGAQAAHDSTVPPSGYQTDKVPNVGAGSTAKTEVRSAAIQHARDAMPLPVRGLAAAFCVAALAGLAELVVGSGGDSFLPIGITICVGAAAALFGRNLVHMANVKSGLLTRLLIGPCVFLAVAGMGLVFAFWDEHDFHIMHPLAIAFPFFVFDWFTLTSNLRSQRLTGWILGIGALCAFGIASSSVDVMWLPQFPAVAAVLAFGIGICAQLVSPFTAVQVTKGDSHSSSPFRAGSPNAAGKNPSRLYQAEPVATVAASPSVPSPPRYRWQKNDLNASLDQLRRSTCVVLGLLLFTASSVLAIIAMQPVLMHGYPFGNRALSMVGFGLIVPAFGLLIASGNWMGGAFGRMIAACCMMAWLQISFVTGEFEPAFALILPLSVALLAYPSKKVPADKK